MGYLLRMSGEIRDWLTGLGTDDPAAAKAIGCALLALLREGESLGPPLVTTVSDPPPDDLTGALDQAYQFQLDQLAPLRRLCADAALLVRDLEGQIERLVAAADEAAATAGVTAAGRDQLAELRRLLPGARENLRELTEASQRAQSATDAFRVRKEVLKATYTAARAQVEIAEMMADVEPEDSTTEAERDLELIRAQINRELNEGAPDELRELRPSGYGTQGIGVLFAIEPAGTALLISVVEGARRGSAEYRAAVAVSADIMRQVRAGQDPQASECAFDDEWSFLAEFFPENSDDVAAGATALVQRSRIRGLEQQRIDRGLTRAQVARRMGMSPDRVAAIEGADLGGVTLRELTRYVDAIGGQLDVTAQFGAERVPLAYG